MLPVPDRLPLGSPSVSQPAPGSLGLLIRVCLPLVGWQHDERTNVPSSPVPTALPRHRYMLQRLEIEPDEITLHCVLEACGRAGRWVHGLRCGRRLQRSSAVGRLCCMSMQEELQAYPAGSGATNLPVWRQRRRPILHLLAAAPFLSTLRLHPFHPSPSALAANRYFVALVDRFGAHRNVMCLEFADPDTAGGQPGFACSCCAGSPGCLGSAAAYLCTALQLCCHRTPLRPSPTCTSSP